MTSERTDAPSPGYEPTDVPGRGIGWFAVSFVGLSVVLVVAVTIFGTAVWDLGPERPMETAPGREVPGPNLQADPAAELEAYRAEARERLESFGWVDRERGIAHIPIGEAMRLMANRAGRGVSER